MRVSLSLCGFLEQHRFWGLDVALECFQPFSSNRTCTRQGGRKLTIRPFPCDDTNDNGNGHVPSITRWSQLSVTDMYEATLNWSGPLLATTLFSAVLRFQTQQYNQIRGRNVIGLSMCFYVCVCGFYLIRLLE